MITVFYGRQVYGEFIALKEMRQHITVADPVYQEGCYHARGHSDTTDWFTLDGCPMLLEDVPKPIQMLALVLGL